MLQSSFSHDICAHVADRGPTRSFAVPHSSYVQNISTLYRLCITFLGRQTPSDFITQCFYRANATPRGDLPRQVVDLHVNSQYIRTLFTPHSEIVQTVHRARPAAIGPVGAGPVPPPGISHPRLRSPRLARRSSAFRALYGTIVVFFRWRHAPV